MAAKKRPSTVAARAPSFGAGGAASSLGDEITRRNAWGDEADPRFREYVAREHLDGGMPLVELHRNHGIPLSAVKRWIATYAASGREGVEREAAADAQKAAAREAKLAAKAARVDPAEVAALAAQIASPNLAAKRAAYAVVRKRRLAALIPAILDAVRWADTQSDVSIQDELELLAALKAKDALHELLGSRLKVVRRYESWFASLLEKAGCSVRTVEKPGSLEYELGGAWFPVRAKR